MKLRTLLSLVFLFHALSLSAADAFLPKSFRAQFEQVTVSIVSGKEKVSTGSLDYQYPSNLRLSIEKPDPLLLISNRQKTWFYRPPFIEGEREELTVKDSGKSELAQFFDILQQGLVDNSYYKVKKSNAQVQLDFTAQGSKSVGVLKALLHFKSKLEFQELTSILVTQNTKKNFELRFNKIETDVTFPATHFIFTKPSLKN